MLVTPDLAGVSRKGIRRRWSPPSSWDTAPIPSFKARPTAGLQRLRYLCRCCGEPDRNGRQSDDAGRGSPRRHERLMQHLRRSAASPDAAM